MATKKFTIPSLSELEQSKHGEYKAKTLFDQHKTSPKKNEAKSSAVNGTNERPVKRPAEHSDSQMDKVAQKRVKTAEATASVSSRKLTTETTQVSRDSTSNTGNTSDSVNVDVKGNTSVTPVPGSPPRTSSATVAPPLAISPSRPSKSSNLVVSSRQRGNPLLKFVRNVPWEYSADIVADYELGATACALFLSLRYHALKPDYIHERLKLLGHSYDLRVLLVQVDTKDPHHALKELSRICILADCTLICAWSPEEAARYLETYKMFERKPPDLIMEKQEVDFVSRAQDVLTSGRKINRTDALTLLSRFGTVDAVVRASDEELAFCPGLGAHKAGRLHALLHQPFLKSSKTRKTIQNTDK